MASEDGTAPDQLTLEERLAAHVRRFDAYAALRALECLHRNKPRLGTARRPSEEPLRLGQSVSLAFAPAALDRYESDGGSGVPRLGVHFFGVFGPNGPLPLHMTELAYLREHQHHDATLRRFADVFHHRLLSFFYRAWADAQPTVSLDRPESDRFRLYLGALVGLGTERVRERDALPDVAKLFFAGRLLAQPRNAEGLEGMIREFFDVDARVEPFAGEWIEMPSRARCRLGASPETGALGTTLMLGERVWDCQHKFRIVVGPLDRERFQRFLPGSPAMERLSAMVRRYVGDELAWDLRLILAEGELAPVSLDGTTSLGWTSWLCSEPPEGTLDDLVVTP
jgi:type VI secretion system protein ImpH